MRDRLWKLLGDFWEGFVIGLALLGVLAIASADSNAKSERMKEQISIEAQTFHKIHGDQCERRALEFSILPFMDEGERYRWHLISQHCVQLSQKDTP